MRRAGEVLSDLNDIIREVSRRSQIDADFIASVIRAESGGQSLMRFRAKARKA